MILFKGLFLLTVSLGIQLRPVGRCQKRTNVAMKPFPSVGNKKANQAHQGVSRAFSHNWQKQGAGCRSCWVRWAASWFLPTASTGPGEQQQRA